MPDGEDDDVRLDPFQVDLNPLNLGEALGKEPGVFVILTEPLDHRLEGYDPSGRNHACLAHPTSQELSESPGPMNEFAASGDERTDGGREAFRETEHDRICPSSEFRRRNPRSHRCVKNTRSIQVNTNPRVVGQFKDLLE